MPSYVAASLTMQPAAQHQHSGGSQRFHGVPVPAVGGVHQCQASVAGLGKFAHWLARSQAATQLQRSPKPAAMMLLLTRTSMVSLLRCGAADHAAGCRTLQQAQHTVHQAARKISRPALSSDARRVAVAAFRILQSSGSCGKLFLFACRCLLLSGSGRLQWRPQ